jgi:DNA processing protein
LNKRKPIRECVALTLIKTLGAQRIYRLIDKVQHPQDVFRLTKPELLSVEGVGHKTAEAILTFNGWDKVDKILDRTRQIGAKLITLTHDFYPPLLKQIYDPPLLLWVLGSLKAVARKGLAVVGTRRPSRYGQRQARHFSGIIARSQVPVISGLAHGIDTISHQTTIKQRGVTIAVLGSGIDVIYPAANKKLARHIIDSGGAIISEFPPGTKPGAGNFPVRNRIVSGMTLGTIVVESGLEGGSMITASSASDQNREVFAVPHSLENESGIGCNAMIRRGHAKLIQNAEHIWEELPFEPVQVPASNGEVEQASKTVWRKMNLSKTAISVCSLLEQGKKHIDEICEKLSIPQSILMSELLQLEMKRCVRQLPGKVFELS